MTTPLKSAPPILTFDEFATRYCERQQYEYDDLLYTLTQQVQRFNPDGWMLLECADMSSSRLGELTILPFGGKASYKEVPTHPVSPRGLASDMSTVVAVLPKDNLPTCDRRPLPEAEQEVLAYIKSLKEGERVVETGDGPESGRHGTITKSLVVDNDDLSVKWDKKKGEESDPWMITPITWGTRRCIDAQVEDWVVPDTLRVYDNGGETMDRYTVLRLDWPYNDDPNDKIVQCLGMGTDPRGYCNHGGAMDGDHLGQLIEWNSLPKPCKEAAKHFLED